MVVSWDFKTLRSLTNNRELFFHSVKIENAKKINWQKYEFFCVLHRCIKDRSRQLLISNLQRLPQYATVFTEHCQPRCRDTPAIVEPLCLIASDLIGSNLPNHFVRNLCDFKPYDVSIRLTEMQSPMCGCDRRIFLKRLEINHMLIVLR